MKRHRSGPIRWSGIALLLFLAAGGPGIVPAVRAQIAGQRIRSFRVPEYDDEGRLKWVFSGDEALFREDGTVHITGVKVEIYRDGRVDMLLRSPECDYGQDQKRAWTDAPVEITAPNLSIRGEGMDWKAEDGVMVLKRKVRVTVLNPKEGMTREPAEPAAAADSGSEGAGR